VLQVGSIGNYEFAASNQRAVNGGVGTLKTYCFFQRSWKDHERMSQFPN
jgi:hypothetical protein